jgi:hypothetical protein
MTFIRSRGLRTAAALLVAGVLAPTSAQAFCPSASGATDKVWNLRPTNRCEGPDAQKTAQKICKALVKVCKKRVKATIKCGVTQAKIEAALRVTGCGLESEADPKACKASSKQTLKSNAGDLKQAKKTYLDVCASYLGLCISDC